MKDGMRKTECWFSLTADASNAACAALTAPGGGGVPPLQRYCVTAAWASCVACSSAICCELIAGIGGFVGRRVRRPSSERFASMLEGSGGSVQLVFPALHFPASILMSSSSWISTLGFLVPHSVPVPSSAALLIVNNLSSIRPQS